MFLFKYTHLKLREAHRAMVVWTEALELGLQFLQLLFMQEDLVGAPSLSGAHLVSCSMIHLQVNVHRLQSDIRATETVLIALYINENYAF